MHWTDLDGGFILISSRPPIDLSCAILPVNQWVYAACTSRFQGVKHGTFGSIANSENVDEKHLKLGDYHIKCHSTQRNLGR